MVGRREAPLEGDLLGIERGDVAHLIDSSLADEVIPLEPTDLTPESHLQNRCWVELGEFLDDDVLR